MAMLLMLLSLCQQSEGRINVHCQEGINSALDSCDNGIVSNIFYCGRRRLLGGRICISKYESGNLKIRAVFHRGVCKGWYLTYYESGKRESRGRFSHGMPNGKWKYYDESGRLISKGRLYFGKRTGIWIFYTADNGEVKVDYGNITLRKKRTNH